MDASSPRRARMSAVGKIEALAFPVVIDGGPLKVAFLRVLRCLGALVSVGADDVAFVIPLDTLK
eukprot:369612-Pyramimonas_sp.AAC.1